MTHRVPRLHLLWLGAAIGVLWSVAPAAVHAQDSLFDQGRGMLEGVLQSQPGGSDLGDAEIGAGLREALRVGTERVTASLGRVDGFNTNPDVHIRCPKASRRSSPRWRWSVCPASPMISSCA